MKGTEETESQRRRKSSKAVETLGHLVSFIMSTVISRDDLLGGYWHVAF
jgi:hypothetical protein